MDPIITIPHACPICQGPLKGNDQLLYYCEHCNLLFNKKSIPSLQQKTNQQEDRPLQR